LSVITVQATLPALMLFAPLLLIGALVFGLAGSAQPRGHARPALFTMPGAALWRRLADGVRSATVPEQYRSIVNPKALEKAAAGGRPLLWIAMLVALAYAVNR
jgi:hypothetical protein